MGKRNLFRLAGVNLIILSLFILDRLLKGIALAGFKKDLGLFNFSLWRNSGLIFNLSLPEIIFYPIIFVILFWLVNELVKSYQKEKKLRIFGLSLIIVGALSNLFDRLLFGRVIDYLIIPLTIFNLSDLMIIGGVLIVLFDYLRVRRSPNMT